MALNSGSQFIDACTSFLYSSTKRLISLSGLQEELYSNIGAPKVAPLSVTIIGSRIFLLLSGLDAFKENTVYTVSPSTVCGIIRYINPPYHLPLVNTVSSTHFFISEE